MEEERILKEVAEIKPNAKKYKKWECPKCPFKYEAALPAFEVLHSCAKAAARGNTMIPMKGVA